MHLTQVAAAPNGETRIPIALKRVSRAAFVAQLTQHLPAVITIIAAGASAVQSDREGGGLALAAAELIVGALVIATIAREAWHLFGRHSAHVDVPPPRDSPRIDGPGLAAAALGYVEVWHHTHARGHFKLVSPYMLGATATLFLALGGRYLIARRFRHRRPHLLITPDRVTYRGSRRRRWTTAWADVAGVDWDESELTVRLRDGSSHVIRADDHFGGAGLLAAARDAVATHAPHRIAAPGRRSDDARDVVAAGAHAAITRS